jgi:hypothetical protein
MRENRLLPAHTHNQTLAVLYALNGGINLFFIIVALIILMLIKEKPLMHLGPKQPLVLVLSLSAVLAAALYLATGIGLWKRMRWARTSALILGILFAWYIPVGLGLGLYAWLFLRSKDGEQLYKLNQDYPD